MEWEVIQQQIGGTYDLAIEGLKIFIIILEIIRKYSSSQ